MDNTVLLVIFFDFSWKNYVVNQPRQQFCSRNVMIKTTEDKNDLVSRVFCFKTTDILYLRLALAWANSLTDQPSFDFT